MIIVFFYISATSHIININIKSISLMSTSAKHVQRYSDPRVSPTCKINKISNFQFMNFANHSELESISRRNPRNSFYAQKFKKFQNRPHSSMPDSNKKAPITSPVRLEEPKNMAVMGSFFVNTKPNTRRVTNSLASYHAELIRKNASENDSIESRHKIIFQRSNRPIKQSQQLAGKKSGETVIYEQILNGMNQYINLVKLSSQKRNEQKNSEKRYASSECKSRETQKYYFQQGNLNIKGLITNPVKFNNNIRKVRRSNRNEDVSGDSTLRQQQISIAIGQKLITQQIVSIQQPQKLGIEKYRSAFEKQSPKKSSKFSNCFISNSPQKREQSKSPTKRNTFIVEYFGKIKQSTPLEELQRLKAMYYRDLIWKVWFNSDWKIKVDAYAVGVLDPPRYFVGRGNNSKLIKALMGRRWWWKLQTKQQNANFLWTQLKIYSAYQKQVLYDKVNLFEQTDAIIQKQQKAIAETKNQYDDPIINIQDQEIDIGANIDKQQEIQLLQLSTNAEQNLRKTDRQEEEIKLSARNNNEASLLSRQKCNEVWWEQKLKLRDKNVYLLTQQKFKNWSNYIKNANNAKKELKSSEALQTRRQLQKNMKIHTKYPQKVTNHLEYSRLIGNKKALYKTMSTYYELSKKNSRFLPMTYHIQGGLEDKEYLKFLNQYFRRSKQQNNSMWIVKPGQMSNRGCGITVCDDIQQIKKILKNKKTHTNGKSFTYIVQQYIREPFLYQGRKFDIRHYIMINSSFGRIKGYFYEEGYIRTTSYKYSNKNQDSLVHLTNDAVQKHCKDYGKYEKGNKVSYEEFEKYLKSLPESKQKQYSFFEKILPKIREISIDIINASYYLIDPKRKGNNFQIFGLDIMIDSDFRPWLIEVNTNPCLELSSPVLSKVIPRMLDNAFAISLDPLFPPPNQINIGSKKNSLPDNFIIDNRFELVFDEVTDGNKLNKLYDQVKDQLSQMDGYGSDEQAYESAEDDCSADY